MKTRELGSINTSNEGLRTQEKSLLKKVRSAMNDFGNSAIGVLREDPKYTRSELELVLGKILGADINKLIATQQEESMKQVENMLSELGLGKTTKRKGGLNLISLVRANPMKKSRR